MKSQDKIKALNIVFTYWINPSIKIKLNALKKIQRFCRRGSGAHAHHRMICNLKTYDLSPFPPPVLFRQRQSCMRGYCESIPIRIYNKFKRMRYAIDKIFDHDEENGYNFDCPTETTQPTQPNRNIFEGELKNEKILIKHYTCNHTCYCNNIPIRSYIEMVTQPRGNFTSLDGIKYIMCELSGDELTYYTRFKLSQFLTHRLSSYHCAS